MAATATAFAGDPALSDFYGLTNDEVIEIRCLTKGQPTIQHYTPVRDLDVRALPTSRAGVYFVPNRKADAFAAKPATDKSIEAWRSLMIDMDPVRVPKDRTATDEEQARALDRGKVVREYLDSIGLPEDSAAHVSSGNGCQIWIRLDELPATPDVRLDVSRIVNGLAAMFSDDAVTIDRSVVNEARVYPLPGSVKRKGAGPHREVAMVAPAIVFPLSRAELRALADRIAPIATASPAKPGPAKVSDFTRANAAGDLRAAAAARGMLRENDNVVCPGCHRDQGSTSRILPSKAAPGTFVVMCATDTCKPHQSGVYTYVDAVAGWDGISEREAAKHHAPPVERTAAANDTGPRFGVVWLDVEELFKPQPDADYLVKDLGISAGAPTMIVGQGGVGKTMVAMALAISVATGRPIWDTDWTPSRTGKVAHFDYEMGRRLDAVRLQRLALGMNVTAAELAGKWRTVVHAPMKLTDPRALDFLCYAFDGLAMVILDSARALMPGVEENSSQVRDYLDLTAVASEKTGCVPVIIHHAGKTPMGGTKARKEMGRGSSAFFDAASSYFVMTGEKARPFLLTHEKNREQGTYVPDQTLQIKDTPGGGLLVCPAAEGVAASPGAQGLDVLKAGVMSLLAGIGGGLTGAGLSQNALATHLKVRRLDVATACEELQREGRIISNGARGNQARWITKAR